MHRSKQVSSFNDFVGSDQQVGRYVQAERPPRFSAFRDFHEPFLNELCRPRHGIRVDLDARQQVRIAPPVDFCSCTTQFDLHAALHQIRDKSLVRVAGRDVPVGIVGAIFQRHMAPGE